MIGRLTGFSSSIALSGALFYIVWGGYQPTVPTVEDGMWLVFTLGVFLLAYLGVQAYLAFSHHSATSLGWAMDIILSVLPLFIAGAALVGQGINAIALSPFQWIAVILAGFTAMIDLVLFTFLAQRSA